MLWRSDWRVLVPRKVVDKSLTVEHRLVIRLPNDGFFFVEESVLNIKKSPVKNDPHGQRDGWALANPEAWENLDPSNHPSNANKTCITAAGLPFTKHRHPRARAAGGWYSITI
jgi:hypothetical protein